MGPSGTWGDFSLGSTSGVYYVLLGIGVTSNKGIYSCVILSELLSLACLSISSLNRNCTDQALNYGASKNTLASTYKAESAHMSGLINRFLSLTSASGIRINLRLIS